MKYWRQFPCRCRVCRARKTLAKAPSDYVRQQPRCWSCGARNWVIDRFRRNREHRKYACTCGGLHGIYNWAGPHRRGSRWCHYSTNPPTDAEILEKFASD